LHSVRRGDLGSYDIVDKDLGKAIPYGVYDIAANAGCVSVGISNDTAQFVVNSIRCWLDTMGRGRYPDMNQLMIRADGGGSNGSRVRLFKLELQRLAQETGLTIKVCQLSAGDIEVEQNRCVTNTSSKEGDVELYERWG
jgi:hypothetical protein